MREQILPVSLRPGTGDHVKSRPTLDPVDRLPGVKAVRDEPEQRTFFVGHDNINVDIAG